MISVIIDGNNLIGKSRRLREIQKKDKQLSREKLAFLLERFFITKKENVFLHFDGFENEPINVSKIKIEYSGKMPADDKIRRQIESAKNSKNLNVVTSDGSLRDFAKVCRCKVTSSEDFLAELEKDKIVDDEKQRIDSMNNVDVFKKLFNVK